MSLCCLICQCAGKRRSYSRYLYEEHPCCMTFSQNLPPMTDAVKKINSLYLHDGRALHAMASVPITKEESNSHIFDKLRVKIHDNHQIKSYNYNIVVNFDKICLISKKDAKKVIMDALFYEYYKHNVGYRNHDSREYKILYAALFGNSLSLQSQCLEQIQHMILQKQKSLKDKTPVKMPKLYEESNSQQFFEKGDQKEVVSENADSLEACEEEICHFNDIRNKLPKTIYEELSAVQYFYGRDVGSLAYALSSDDLLVSVNRQNGWAVGIYFFYDRYHG